MICCTKQCSGKLQVCFTVFLICQFRISEVMETILGMIRIDLNPLELLLIIGQLKEPIDLPGRFGRVTSFYRDPYIRRSHK